LSPTAFPLTAHSRHRQGPAQESARFNAAGSVGLPCAGSTSSMGRSSSGRSRWATSSRVRCVRPPSWTSSPSPKSEIESPVTIVLIDGSQRRRSLFSRPAYALMPNGHAPGAWKCPLPYPRAARRGRHSPCHARGRGRRRTSQPSRARCLRAACESEGRADERRARGTEQSGRRRSRARANHGERTAGRTTGTRHEFDAVGRNELGPPLLLVPVRVRRLPVPDTGAQLTHGARCYLCWPIGAIAFV
jgi:hypothetical protein